MKSSTKRSMLTAALICALTAISVAVPAQDKEAVIKNREALMKGQGKDLGSVKAYTEGKGDLAQAEASAVNLTQTIRKIPDAFPPGTGGSDSDGKFATKPAIWSDWDKFIDAQKNAASKADALLVAVKSGNKTAVETAFGDLGKNGSGACHEA